MGFFILLKVHEPFCILAESSWAKIWLFPIHRRKNFHLKPTFACNKILKSPARFAKNPPNRSTMASSSPPILPISAGESQPPVATPAFRAFINHITETVRSGLSRRRPWSELVDRSAFSKPESLTEAAIRIRKNYSYFRVNYLTVVAAVVGFSLLTNPFSLIILLGLLAAWLFLYLFRPSDPPLVIFGRTFSERETLGLLIGSSIVVIFLTSVGSVLISALLAGTAVVCAHGAFRAPEDLFLDEQEAGASTGFLSFLGGAASNAAASAAPVVAAARA